MRTFTKIATVLLIAIMAVCCKNTVEDNRQAIETAESAVEQSKFDQAREICESLVKANEKDSLLSARDFCRIALTMQKVSEGTNSADLTATAVKCYKSAEKLSGDSIMSYLSSLQPADASIFLNIMLLANNQGVTFGKDDQFDAASLDALPVDTISADSI
ncbi:MAG: hypothetical protein J6Y87_03195 [Muribaculaceae bacterium]|nr:hypothetical protein [Muribaculaceae bacterium]MBR5435502.1 hypothetical protein [Muribaculaceae bacterium]MBR5744342.1 hypothetical protein [Muribaculaceae bacterium]